ncbi:MAG: DHH family phosphoesterase, partial [Candidatus Margulisbacteria bacterium]|nr:DHH family phosphoesterase [Candidatus Margulisiibacteriota bacterium]
MSKFYLKIFSGIEQEIVLRAVQVKTDNYTPELARDFWAGLSRASGPLALAGHDSTDADAVASMLLLWRKLNEQGKDAALYFSQNDLAFVQNNSMLNGLLEQVKKMGAKVYTEGPGADQLPQKYTNLALLDTANANTRNKWLAAREFKHIFEIDHHFGGETLPVDAYIGSNLYASTAGLLGQIFLDNDLSIDKFDAHLLLVSVAGDTAGGRTALSENAWQLLEKLESYINEEADRLSGGELRELLKNILEGYYNGLKDYTAETLELAERLMENRQTISFSLPAGMAAESIKIITLDGGEQPDGKWRY